MRANFALHTGHRARAEPGARALRVVVGVAAPGNRARLRSGRCRHGRDDSHLLYAAERVGPASPPKSQPSFVRRSFRSVSYKSFVTFVDARTQKQRARAKVWGFDIRCGGRDRKIYRARQGLLWLLPAMAIAASLAARVPQLLANASQKRHARVSKPEKLSLALSRALARGVFSRAEDRSQSAGLFVQTYTGTPVSSRARRSSSTCSAARRASSTQRGVPFSRAPKRHTSSSSDLVSFFKGRDPRRSSRRWSRRATPSCSSGTEPRSS